MIKNKIKLLFLTLGVLIDFNLFCFTISEPGFFTLGSDVVEGADVLRVSVSNLCVDLNGYTVTGGTVGIVIDPDLSNITIKNGRIDSNTRGITIGEGCSNITLENLEITNCSRSALEANGTFANPIMRLSLNNIKAELSATSALASDAVMLFSYAVNLIAQNIQIAKNGEVGAGDVKGVYLLNCTKGTLQDITVICNESDSFTGFLIEETTNTFVFGCNVRVNNAIEEFAGFRFTGTNTSGNLCQNCFATNNTCTDGHLAGFELLPFVTYNSLKSCVASNNIATGTQDGANCYGFNFDQPTFCSVVQCRAEGNRAIGDEESSNVCAGFNIGTSGVGTTGTKDCEFCYNQASLNLGSSDFNSFGFRGVSLAFGNTNNAYVANLAIKNGSLLRNQILADGGFGSDPGGVPTGSIRDLSVSTLNIPGDTSSPVGISNIRIV